MTKRDGLFVKINYNNGGEHYKESRKNDKISKNNDMSLRKYLLCAGVYNKNGGTIIFQARNMDEAQQIVRNNPFVTSNVYTYEILKNDVICL